MRILIFTPISLTFAISTFSVIYVRGSSNPNLYKLPLVHFLLNFYLRYWNEWVASSSVSASLSKHVYIISLRNLS